MVDNKPPRLIRYLIPNLFTLASLMFGMWCIVSSMAGDYVLAGWMVMYAVMTDRADGFIARLLRGTSELGVQLDSFADFLNFGLAPAVLMYSFLSGHPDLDFAEGAGRIWLLTACAAWILAATFRLARYNISTEDVPTKIFFGVPTTLAGGLLVAWFLALYKYSTPGETFGGFKLFGDGLVIPAGVWSYFPAAMFVGAYLMASTLRMPKVGVLNSKLINGFILLNVAGGYIFSLIQMFPDYLIWPPTLWLVVFLVWGQLSPAARAMKPSPVFPERDHPPGKQPLRPEDDLLPEGVDAILDEPAAKS